MGQKTNVDLEWVALIQEAVGVGISVKEITDFLEGSETGRGFDSRRSFAG